MLSTLSNLFKQLVAYLPVFIYNAFVGRVITNFVHRSFFNQLKSKGSLKGVKKVLDIGVGTGLPLKQIYPNFEKDT